MKKIFVFWLMLMAVTAYGMEISEVKKDSINITQGSLPCSFCQESLNSWSEWKSHVKKRHPQEKPYKCHYCSYSGRTQEDLTKHIDQMFANNKIIAQGNHGGYWQPYPCLFCDHAEEKEIRLNKHIENFHVKTKQKKIQAKWNAIATEQKKFEMPSLEDNMETANLNDEQELESTSSNTSSSITSTSMTNAITPMDIYEQEVFDEKNLEHNQTALKEAEHSVDRDKENIASILENMNNLIFQQGQIPINSQVEDKQQENEMTEVDDLFVLLDSRESNQSNLNKAETEDDENVTDEDSEFFIREATEEEIANAIGSTNNSNSPESASVNSKAHRKRTGNELKPSRSSKKSRTEITNKQFKCKFQGCDKSYTQIGTLNRHIRDQHGEGYKCRNCNFSGTYNRLLKHKRSCRKTA